jgi:hypothetical protein
MVLSPLPIVCVWLRSIQQRHASRKSSANNNKQNTSPGPHLSLLSRKATLRSGASARPFWSRHRMNLHQAFRLRRKVGRKVRKPTQLRMPTKAWISRSSAFLAQHALEPHGATPPFRYLSLLGKKLLRRWDWSRHLARTLRFPRPPPKPEVGITGADGPARWEKEALPRSRARSG